MISISEKANPNYLAKVVRINNLLPVENADKLQKTVIDFQEVVTGIDTKIGDIVVYFPVECAINQDFLSATDSFRDAELNKGEETGFFEKNCRVKALRLRGQKSSGYIVPASMVENWSGYKNLDNHEGEEFDTIKGQLLLKKYVRPVKESRGANKQGKKPKESRLIEGQVRFHVDTQNLRRTIGDISPNDKISISYKIHGTSFWVGNLLVKRKLSFLEKIASMFGAKIQTSKYDIVYGSRRVVKNESMDTKEHFYGEDVWGDIAKKIQEIVPAGFTLYGECYGYTKGGKEIQKGYDYNLEPGEFKLMVYRITVTNVDGQVVDLSSQEIKEFCDTYPYFIHAPEFYFVNAKASQIYPYDAEKTDLRDWRAGFVKFLEDSYLEGDCYICKNKVPAEGVVIRKESMFGYDAYKLKAFRFLEYETKMLDQGEEDLEELN